jgi:transcriptional regulator with XRE-family HTH domain
MSLDQGDKWVEKDWTLAERFSANLLWFRQQAGLTQQELADRIGMERVSLGELEQGRRLPLLDTILRLVAGLEIRNCDLVAWVWWDPGRHEHYESEADASSGYEVLDFDLPAGFRISPVGYETEERFKDRLRQRMEDPAHRAVLELLRDDAPKIAPRERPDAAWVLRTGQALKALREERGLTHDQLADRAPTTATFIREVEEGRIGDPGLRMLGEICRALDGEGSELDAQIEPMRAAQEAAVRKALDELAERDARKAKE